jgi:tetratricopeptide (TPR) repeat protein
MMLFSFIQSVLIRAIDTPPVRAAVRVLGFGVLACVLCGALLRGEEPAAGEHAVVAGDNAAPSGQPAAAAVEDDPFVAHESKPVLLPPEGPEPRDPAALVAYLLQAARYRRSVGDRSGAEREYARLLHVSAPDQTKRDAVLDLAQFYAEAGDVQKSISALEKFRVTYPDDPAMSEQLLRLGQIYRDAGAVELATARFFAVLNSTLNVAPAELDAYRRLSMKARLEIAETYAMQGKMEEARKYYTRLQVLDLDPEDRELVLFRTGQLQHGLGQWLQAENHLRVFLAEYPQSRHMAEARYLRAKALEELGRHQEAVLEVLELLRTADSPDTAQARVAAYWKRRTGNELANQFYEQGDYAGALAIYQALARASEDPAWRWPAVYQVGLCFERLKMPQRAAEAYRTIVESPQGAGPAESLASVQGMARWRLEHLDWIEDFGKRLQGLTAAATAKT